MQIGQGVLKM